MIETEERAPIEWETSYTIPIYKEKGDALLCGKYRGVRLLEHGMKLWVKILERRLRDIVKKEDIEFGFQHLQATK